MNCYKSRKKNWEGYAALETAQKVHFLRKLSLREGLNIFMELHERARCINGDSDLWTWREAKLEALRRTHVLFNKVKG